MDPITMIVAALAAGASSGVGNAASQAVKDAYANLRALVARRFRHNAEAQKLLADHDQDPVTYERPLAKQLHVAGAHRDADILGLAQQLLRLADIPGSRATYHVQVTGGQVGPTGPGAHVDTMSQTVKVRRHGKRGSTHSRSV